MSENLQEMLKSIPVEIEFEGEKYLVSKETLELSNAIKTGILTDDVHKVLHAWGKWFVEQMVQDMAYVSLGKPCITQKSDYDKFLEEKICDLLKHIDSGEYAAVI